MDHFDSILRGPLCGVTSDDDGSLRCVLVLQRPQAFEIAATDITIRFELNGSVHVAEDEIHFKA